MRKVISIALYTFAQLVQLGVAPWALLHTIIDRIRYKSNRSRIEDAFFEGALALDIFGNVAYSSFLNAYFLKHGGVHFGGRGETISSVLGKNWTIDKLTWLGEGCAGLLNLIDTDHCYKSINEKWLIPKPDPVKWYKIVVFAACLLGTLALICWAFIRILF